MTNALKDRYEVQHPRAEFIGVAATRDEAFQIAQDWATGETGYDDAANDVIIVDSVNRSRRTRLWHLPSEDKK